MPSVNEKRTALKGIVIALAIAFVVTGCASAPAPQPPKIDGLQTFDVPAPHHVIGPVTYPQDPPVGGDHSAVLLNCGIYSQPVPNDNAVHALEHGAVWVTYDASLVTGDALTKLRNELTAPYIVLSPYVGLPAPVVASAWGAQVRLTGVDDPRLQDFLTIYRDSPNAPEPDGPCTGAWDAPGRVTP